MEDYLLTITMVAAYICTLISLSLCAYFITHRKHPLGAAMAFMLFAEGVGMAVLSVFATFEWLGVLVRLDPHMASYFRWAAIAITAASSLHLTCRVKEVITGSKCRLLRYFCKK